MAQALPAIMIAGAVLSAGATVYGGIQQMEAAKEAQEIAERNARLEEMETEEAARRLEKEQETSEALGLARAFALGVGGQSIESYLESYQKENRRQIQWLRRAGSSRADILRAQGSMIGRQGLWSGMGTIAGGIGQLGNIRW